MTIEERVIKAIDAMGDDCYVFCCSEAESAYRDGFTDGANDQQKIDIEKLKNIMSRLMLDTKDKAEIIKVMEE